MNIYFRSSTYTDQYSSPDPSSALYTDAAALPYTQDTAALPYTQQETVPYHELGGSARQQYAESVADSPVYGTRSRSSYSSSSSSEQLPLAPLPTANTGVPYYERGASQRQRVSDEQFKIIQRKFETSGEIDTDNYDNNNNDETVRNFIDTGDSSFTNYDRNPSAAGYDRGSDESSRYDASDRRDIVVQTPRSLRTRVRDSNLIRRRIDTADVDTAPSQSLEVVDSVAARTAVTRRTLHRSRSSYNDRSSERQGFSYLTKNLNL